jgi:hypothetical protein
MSQWTLPPPPPPPPPQLRRCVCVMYARGMASGFEVFQELADLHPIQGQINGSDSIKSLLLSLIKLVDKVNRWSASYKR